MKIWKGYGSEHSSKLVMIGKFKTATKAEKVNEIIAKITEQINSEIDTDVFELGSCQNKFSDHMLELMRELKVYNVGPIELEQFAYDANINNQGNNIIINTDEIDVSAFFKIMIDNGARVEIYSTHDYPDNDHG